MEFFRKGRRFAKGRRLAAVLCAGLLAAQCAFVQPFVSAAEDAAYAQDVAERYALYQKEDPERFTESEAYTISRATPTISSLTHNTRFANYVKVDGIDVSKFQGDINWSKVAKDGVKQVIIRAGFRAYATGEVVEDPKFRTNLEGATAAGLDVGLYFFTQALNTKEAVEEADFVLSKLAGYPLTLPIYIDIENVDYDTGRLDSAGLNNAQRTAICKAFCDTIEAGGYRAGVYANKYWLTTQLNAGELEDRYAIWLAHYTDKTDYTGEYQTWQYSCKGTVSGIDYAVDRDVCYSKKVSYAADGLTIEEIGAAVKPVMVGDGKITYTSSDPAVASVSSTGEIKAIRSGTAVITAASSNGTKDTIEITVGYEKHIRLNYDHMVFADIGASEKLSSSVQVSFASTDESVVTVSKDGVVEAVGFGTADVIAEDDNGNKGVCPVTVAVYEKGDCNLDGRVNASDAATVLSCAAGLGVGRSMPNMTDYEFGLYDYNADGVVNASDASGILLYSAKLGAGSL